MRRRVGSTGRTHAGRAHTRSRRQAGRRAGMEGRCAVRSAAAGSSRWQLAWVLSSLERSVDVQQGEGLQGCPVPNLPVALEKYYSPLV